MIPSTVKKGSIGD